MLCDDGRVLARRREARLTTVSTRPATVVDPTTTTVAGMATSSASGEVWTTFHVDQAIPSARVSMTTAIQNSAIGRGVRMSHADVGGNVL